MNAAWLLILILALFAAAYKLYGTFIGRVFGVDPARKTPAHTRYDGVDFVPAKNWWVLFGHHFSSICGAGPIVGPAMACAYWGWGASLIWIVAGAVLMGAVADFSSLVLSVRHGGESIAEISGSVISKRVRLYFSIFLWISLILVIAVFSIFAAKTFIEEPDAVLPSLGLIPVAVLAGWLMYSEKMNNMMVTLLGLAALGFLLYGGNHLRIAAPDSGWLSAENFWILLLLVYCYVASVTPVQMLLQPRDYLASFVLYAMILIGVAAVFISRPDMQPAVAQGGMPAGPIWPMLFVTIACGAISGFHSVVSSGTTCKQLETEAHACRIGYGGMLLESLVGVLVVIAVSAGLGSSELAASLKTGGPITAFSRGYGNLSAGLLGDYGKVFAVLALNAFILTTLDTATRITRYLTTELFHINNKYLATLIVVAASAALALTGKWNVLWPAFGAANQLIAGIALLIGSCWLIARGKNAAFTLIPALIMLATTVAAFGYQWVQAAFRRSAAGVFDPDWPLAFITGALILMALVIMAEAWGLSQKSRVRQES